MSPAMRFDPVGGVLIIPALAAMLLAVLPGYRLTARINVIAALRHVRRRLVAVLRPARAKPLLPRR